MHTKSIPASSTDHTPDEVCLFPFVRLLSSPSKLHSPCMCHVTIFRGQVIMASV